ncbi:MAG: hypothetical protein F4Y45_04070 [Acidobacteria bacterium]|nr:hypothetical protein [Acidobacteriota bacterium]
MSRTSGPPTKPFNDGRIDMKMPREHLDKLRQFAAQDGLPFHLWMKRLVRDTIARREREALRQGSDD